VGLEVVDEEKPRRLARRLQPPLDGCVDLPAAALDHSLHRCPSGPAVVIVLKATRDPESTVEHCGRHETRGLPTGRPQAFGKRRAIPKGLTVVVAPVVHGIAPRQHRAMRRQREGDRGMRLRETARDLVASLSSCGVALGPSPCGPTRSSRKVSMLKRRTSRGTSGVGAVSWEHGHAK